MNETAREDEGALPGEELLKKPITRQGVRRGRRSDQPRPRCSLRAAGGRRDRDDRGSARDRGAAATPAPTRAHRPRRTRRRSRRVSRDGMYGGPVGFPGAERYQYPVDSEEGRAIQALRAMVQDGTAPDTLIVQVLDFAEAAVRDAVRAPDGAAPRSSSSSRRRRGSRSSSSRPTPADEYTDEPPERLDEERQLRRSSPSAIEEIGDFAEAGLLLPLDEYVDKYQPAGATRVRLRGRRDDGHPVHQVQGRDLLRRVRQRHAAVRLPLRPVRRTPTSRRNFEDKYGSPLRSR